MAEKVLIVDDDLGFRTMLSRVLEDEGYSVATAEGGGEAIALIEHTIYDLIVLDIKMPKIDGIAVLRRLREVESSRSDQPESGVIINTGYSDDTTPIEALKLGVSDYLIKPFELSDFIASVERNMKMVRLRHENVRYMKELAKKNDELQMTIKELHNTRDKLLFSEKLATIGKFASVIGHELRNPLASIENAVYLLEKKAQGDEPAKRYIEILMRAVMHSRRIISDLLEFSKDRKLEITEHSLTTIVNEIVDSHPLKSGISISLAIDPLADRISADGTKIRQVLINLIQNAIEAMPQGGTVLVAAAREQDQVIIKVKDT
ncbi:MAG: hypothetical protein A3J81_01665, partial [Nitrospirae bacterium RIFOXYB2_FULL_43_5]